MKNRYRVLTNGGDDENSLEFEERVLVLPQHRHGRLFQRVGVRVEIGGVCVSRDGWDNRSLQLSVEKLFPVEALEPLVFLDVVGAAFETAVALREISHQQLLDEGLGVAVKMSWEGDLASQDLLVDTHGVIVHEGRLSSHHLIQQNSQRPPINSLAVTLIQQDLWSNVFRRATQGVCFESHSFGKPKVRDLQITTFVQQQVFWLQISINVVGNVHELKDENYLSAVESRSCVVKAPCFSQVSEKFTTNNIFKNHVEVLNIYEQQPKRIVVN